MKSAVDTNVVIALVGNQPSGAQLAGDILKEAHRSGALVICGVVYAELLAHPRISLPRLTQFLDETGVEPEFDTNHQIWQEAGMRYARYAARRRKTDAGHPRRLLADFVIGAHALLRTDRLITFDSRGYRDFPELQITPQKVQ